MDTILTQSTYLLLKVSYWLQDWILFPIKTVFLSSQAHPDPFWDANNFVYNTYKMLFHVTIVPECEYEVHPNAEQSLRMRGGIPPLRRQAYTSSRHNAACACIYAYIEIWTCKRGQNIYLGKYSHSSDIDRKSSLLSATSKKIPPPTHTISLLVT
jgi:hypothetical protein